MELDFFTNLPSEIILNILLRLPVRTIISCKCVRKSWLDLLDSDEFVKSHLSQSVLGLLFLQSEVYEFEDGLDLERHELHYKPAIKFDYTAFVAHPNVIVQGTINGLLLLHDHTGALHVCNPITRDYVKLPCPQLVDPYSTIVSYGFGAIKSTGEHKVVRIFHGVYSKGSPIPKSGCQVHTLGTGSWKSIGSGAPLNYRSRGSGEFLNGNLHWLVFDLDNSQWISCFDLQNELFSTLCAIPEGKAYRRLSILENCLCLCDASSCVQIDIWLMKEYGVEESWTKEFVIEMPEFVGRFYDIFRPIEIFEDGDILIAWHDCFLFYYSNRTKSSRKIDMFRMCSPASRIGTAMRYTLSFLSLKSFGIQNVRLF